MASKGNVGQIVITALGAVVSPVVAVLLVTPLDSGSTLAVMALNALPALAIGVAAGLATIFAARLLTFLGRKVRPWFRTPATKLKALEPQIEDLYRYNMHQLLDSKQIDDLSVNRFLQRCNELRAKLNKLGIPSPEPLRGGFSRWRDFLRILHGCVIQGDVKKAKGLLERLEAADQKRAADGNKAESDAPLGDVVGG